MNRKEKELANKLHEYWRELKKLAEGSYELCFEPTTDRNWKKLNKAESVDLANTEYSKLPTDWKKEYNVIAEAAINSLSFNPDGKADIEKTSVLIHKSCLKKYNLVTTNLNVAYDKVCVEKKEKYRKAAHLAFEMC